MYNCLFVECFRCFQTNWGRSDLKKRVTLRNALDGVNTTRWHTSFCSICFCFDVRTKPKVRCPQHRMLNIACCRLLLEHALISPPFPFLIDSSVLSLILSHPWSLLYFIA